jgi:serine protease Do
LELDFQIKRIKLVCLNKKFKNSVREEKMKQVSILLLLISAAVLSASCDSSFAKFQQPAEKTQTEESKPNTPIVVDGNRTSYADVVDKTSLAVVRVSVEVKAKKQQMMQGEEDGGGFPFPFPGMPQMPQQPQRQQKQSGVGSGVIVSADGTILTNNHVIDGADKITVHLDNKNKDSFDAKVVGTDPATDLAVLKVEGKDLSFLNLGDSDKVRVGDVVLAIGNPLGIGQTVTQGIISAKGRQTNLGDGTSFEDFLQTDAPINRGNSGGALVNLNGELIGINSQILSSGMGGGSIGIGFSIPANMAKNVMEQLLKDGKVQRGMLGIQLQAIDQDLAKSLGLNDTKGAFVGDVMKGSAAEKAGIKREDVITAINGEKVDDRNALRNKVAATKPGTDIKLTILRDGKELELSATLDELDLDKSKAAGKPKDDEKSTDKSESNGKLGVNLEPLTPQITKQLRLPADTKGVVVSEVDADGAAADKGVEQGDVIVAINGTEVSSLEEVKAALEKGAGKPVRLLISRAGSMATITVIPKE